MESIELDDKGKEEAEEPVAQLEFPVAPNADPYKVVLGHAIELGNSVIDNEHWTNVDDENTVQLDLQNSAHGFRLTGRLRGSLAYWRAHFKAEEMITRHESYVCQEEQSEIQVFSATIQGLLGGQYNAVGVYQLYEVPADRSFRLVFATDAVAATLHPPHATPLQGTLTLWFKEPSDNNTCCDLWLVAWPRIEMSALASLWHFGFTGSLAESAGTTLRAALLKRQPSAHK